METQIFTTTNIRYEANTKIAKCTSLWDSILYTFVIYNCASLEQALSTLSHNVGANFTSICCVDGRATVHYDRSTELPIENV